MAEDGYVLRPLTQSEKRDTVELDGKRRNYETEFRNKVVKVELEFAKRHEPYCARCAKMDFYDNVSKFLTERGRKGSEEAVDVDLILRECSPELQKYGKPDHFDLLDEAEVYEDKIIDGMRQHVLTGMNRNFKCRTRGGKNTGGVCVFVPKGFVPAKK